MSPKVVTSSAKLKRLRSPPDKCCKRAVNVCTLMSNCGRKLEIRIICVRSIATLLTTTSPVKLPRKRCDIAANNVVLPAPLQPNTATKSPYTNLIRNTVMDEQYEYCTPRGEQ
uniref:Uncharacterized protein n=1 Tax=Glossina pallidipes TaxID=7398 RepID=A0A1B0ABN8_GLOPL